MRGGDDLWVKAAELEQQFEGYKRRIAERKALADHPDGGGGGELGGDGAEAEEAAVVVGSRGRRYEAYVRTRDEKLRQGWRARMERKEAEMKALWARLDADRRRSDGDLVAGHAKEQKPGNLELKPSSSSTPRSSSATKAITLSRPRTPRSTMPSPSPAAAAASPRLSSIPDSRRRAPHRDPSQIEPPSTPRKENRVPPSTATAAASPAATTTPRLRALSRSRNSLKEYSVRDSPRPTPPPRFQSPRPSHDGAAGEQQPVFAPATGDAVAGRKVVLAEIKTAASFRLRRSGNGLAASPSPSTRPVITRQVDGRRRPSWNTGKTSNAQMISTNSDVKSNNFSITEDDDAAQSSVKLDDLKITGDSDTEISCVNIKKHNNEEAMNTSQSQSGPLAASASVPNAEEPEAPATHQPEKEAGDLEESTTMETPESTAKQIPATDEQQDASSPESSDQSFYSNVDSSFSHRSSELAASATCSPLHGSPSSNTTEQLLEADAAMLRKKREEEEEEEDDDAAAAGEIKRLLIPTATAISSTSGVACPVAGAVQSPMEAVAGLKRFLTFGKKNASVKAGGGERAPADDDGVGEGWPSGDSGVRQRICSSDVAVSDDSDNNYVISAHVRSLQSCVPCSSAKPVLLKELISSAKSPRAHRSFFSFSSFKSRGY